MAFDVSIEMLDSVATIHEQAARANELLDQAEVTRSFPGDLTSLLAELAAWTDTYVRIYAPSEDPNDPQPVGFFDAESGWDFAAWMHEKCSRMQESAHRAVRDWDDLAGAIDRAERSWADHLQPFDPSNLGPTPVNLYQAFRSLFEVERMAAVIFEMLDERLAASAPGPGCRLPTRAPDP